MAGEKPDSSATDQEEHAARERSRALTREYAARIFAELFWPAERLIAWIAFRGVARIDEAHVETNLHTATWYSGEEA
jgi:hypothetical protein